MSPIYIPLRKVLSKYLQIALVFLSTLNCTSSRIRSQGFRERRERQFSSSDEGSNISVSDATENALSL